MVDQFEVIGNGRFNCLRLSSDQAGAGCPARRSCSDSAEIIRRAHGSFSHDTFSRKSLSNHRLFSLRASAYPLSADTDKQTYDDSGTGARIAGAVAARRAMHPHLAAPGPAGLATLMIAGLLGVPADPRTADGSRAVATKDDGSRWASPGPRWRLRSQIREDAGILGDHAGSP